MDSSRKRKASNATHSSSDGTTAKKIKLLNSNALDNRDGLAQVQKVGLKLIGMLHNAQDKYGRSIADAFVTLPPRDELPDYYQVVRLPIAIDDVEAKLRRNAYPTITTLESDLKRMVQNAKDYNQPKSDVYEDAERIRKLVYNYMKINNPQYQLDPNYSSFPTPIPNDTTTPVPNGTTTAEPEAPSEADQQESDTQDGTKDEIVSAPKESLPPSDRRESTAAASAIDDDGPVDLDLTGKSFLEAQQMILAELIQFADDEGLEIYTPFVNLPSRKLEDYYRVIKHPVSLKSVQKRARGQHGRNPPTGLTDFKTWDAFEEELSFIWRNAREYNEDGSEMFELAGEFETHVKSRLAEAREKVEEPTGTRIKIGAPRPKSGITLNLTQHRESSTPGVTVDSEALARQRQMVQAGVNGSHNESHSTPTVNGVKRPSSQISIPEVARRLNSAAPVASPGVVVKDERTSTQSPAPNAAAAVQAATAPVAAVTNGTMAPPLTRPSSSSPFPPPPGTSTVSSFHYTAPALLPPTAIRAYPIAQALLPVISISTHPHLKVPKPFNLALPPHVSLSHQSTTITLPSSHYYLQIAPTISKDLSMGRPYKMFVTVNGSRLTQRDTQLHTESGKRTHVYEGSLAHGVNRIEVEVVAAKQDGNGDSKGLDVEKVTIFANLMR